MDHEVPEGSVWFGKYPPRPASRAIDCWVAVTGTCWIKVHFRDTHPDETKRFAGSLPRAAFLRRFTRVH